MMRRSKYVPLAGAVLLLVAAGCEVSPVADPLAGPQHSLTQRSLLVCPPAAESETEGYIGIGGGVLQAGGVQFIVPAGALLQTTKFRLKVPSSPYVEVDIRANGEDHFHFLKPVVLTLDYKRCGGVPVGLSVWYVDSGTKALLENMGGVDDRINSRITFATVHLSGYAIAD